MRSSRRPHISRGLSIWQSVKMIGLVVSQLVPLRGRRECIAVSDDQYTRDRLRIRHSRLRDHQCCTGLPSLSNACFEVSRTKATIISHTTTDRPVGFCRMLDNRQQSIKETTCERLIAQRFCIDTTMQFLHLSGSQS